MLLIYESFPWMIFVILAALGLVSLWLALSRPIKPSRWLLASLILLMLIGSGLYLAFLTGVKASALAGRSSGELEGSQVLLRFWWALLIGGIIGLILVAALRWLSRQALPQLRARFAEEASFPLWKRLVIAFYSGILEETIFRLFLLSLLAWLIGLVWHSGVRPASSGALWIANIVAGVVFGMAHLPRWANLTRLTPGLITALISMNGFAGLVFGALYFTFGIEAAIIAHFIGDCVLHIIGPRFLGDKDQLSTT